MEEDGEEMDDNISEDNSIEAASGNGFPKKQSHENGGKENGLAAAPANSNMLHFWQNIQGHIQDLVKTAISNAKDEDESKSEDSQSHKDGEKHSKYLISADDTLTLGPHLLSGAVTTLCNYIITHTSYRTLRHNTHHSYPHPFIIIVPCGFNSNNDLKALGQKITKRKK